MQKKIGLTGGIASGKTTVTDMFQTYGAYIIDADRISHTMIEPGQPGYKPVLEMFGTSILNDDETINRERLRSIVFNDSQKRSQINDILHPLVRSKISEEYESIITQNPSRIIIHDIPLLIETGSYKYFDVIILVYVSRDIQITRLAQRDGLTIEQAEKLLDIQMPIDRKLRFATHIIDNSQTLDITSIQVQNLLNTLQQT